MNKKIYKANQKQEKKINIFNLIADDYKRKRFIN
jgi:hypothetical protein